LSIIVGYSLKKIVGIFISSKIGWFRLEKIVISRFNINAGKRNHAAGETKLKKKSQSTDGSVRRKEI